MEKTKAELTGWKGTKNVDGTLSAECPNCGALDGYISTGLHTITGEDTVRCEFCHAQFDIWWVYNE